MKINIKFISPKYFDKKSIAQWAWKYTKYKYIKGGIIRIFGIGVNVRENNAIDKLIEIFKNSKS